MAESHKYLQQLSISLGRLYREWVVNEKQGFEIIGKVGGGGGGPEGGWASQMRTLHVTAIRWT